MLILVKKMNQVTENIIAYIHTDYNEKFGIPRQSGLAPSVQGRIVFQPEYRDPEAVRGLEGFSHIWLIWEFSENRGKAWSPTVRPPRLGGNRRMGVFATRSPFRPNPIGLSCVELSEVRLDDPEGPVIVVQGPDLLDGTPILDIKPYIPYADSIPDASSGFLADASDLQVRVVIPEEVRTILGEFPDQPDMAESFQSAYCFRIPEFRFKNDSPLYRGSQTALTWYSKFFIVIRVNICNDVFCYLFHFFHHY